MECIMMVKMDVPIMMDEITTKPKWIRLDIHPFLIIIENFKNPQSIILPHQIHHILIRIMIFRMVMGWGLEQEEDKVSIQYIPMSHQRSHNGPELNQNHHQSKRSIKNDHSISTRWPF